MTYEELMIRSLRSQLTAGEELLYPIYCELHHDNRKDAAFLGFTKSHILVALVSMQKQITATFRLPLDINYIRVKRTKLLHQYHIDIAFSNEHPVRIVAYRRVMMIATQKDNFPLFLEHLKSKAAVQPPPLPKQIKGEKIRRQYFNVPIYLFLMIFSAVPVMLLMMKIKDGIPVTEAITLSLREDIPTFLYLSVIYLSPLIILSILNRFFFGKVLCVIKDGTLLLPNEKIDLKDIKKIVYNPELPSRHNTKYTYAVLHIDQPGKADYQLSIESFPLYGVRKLIKLNPRVALKYNRSFLIMVFLIYAAVIIIPFFM